MSQKTPIALDVVIMAAGKGTRMKSRRPKVLQDLAGQPLVQHVLDTAAQLHSRMAVVITGHGAEEVESNLRAREQGLPLQFVRQEPQLGTGHAVQQAVPVLPDDGVVVVLSGDVPLTRADTLQALLARSEMGLHFFGAMPGDDHRHARLQLCCRAQHMLYQGLTRQVLQHLGATAIHAGAFAGGHDDHVQSDGGVLTHCKPLRCRSRATGAGCLSIIAKAQTH